MIMLFFVASLAHASLAVSRPSLDALLEDDNDVCFFQKGVSTLREGVAHRGTGRTGSTILSKASHALSNFFFGPRHVNAIADNVEDLASNATQNQTSQESASNTHDSQLSMEAAGSEQWHGTLNLLETHRQQANEQQMVAPAAAAYYVSSCHVICHTPKHMDVPWETQSPGNRVAGKCTWQKCAACPECEASQTNLAGNMKRNQTSSESALDTHEVHSNQLRVGIAKLHEANTTLNFDGSEQLNTSIALLATQTDEFESQSQIASEINSKVEELKANIGKVGTSSRKRIKGAREMYQSRLQGQQSNTTVIRKTNKQIRADIKSLVLINTELRQQAENLRNHSLTLRGQVTAAESHLALAQEFAARSPFADSTADMQFLENLRKNESEHAKAQAHDSAVASFGDTSLMSLLQLQGDMEPADLLHTLQINFREASEQEKIAMVSLEQEFKQRLKKETNVQDFLLAEQRKLLKAKETQLALRSKLSSAVEQLRQLEHYLSNRIGHLRLYSLRLSEQRLQ